MWLFCISYILTLKSTFTQIAPYYLSLFWLFRPIIRVILRGFLVFFDIFQHYYRVLFRLFGWTYNKCNFDFFSWKTWRYAIFSSNCALIITYFSTFLAENKGVFVFLLNTGENSQNHTYYRSKKYFLILYDIP